MFRCSARDNVSISLREGVAKKPEPSRKVKTAQGFYSKSTHVLGVFTSLGNIPMALSHRNGSKGLGNPPFRWEAGQGYNSNGIKDIHLKAKSQSSFWRDMRRAICLFRAAVERIRHTQDSYGQILPLDSRPKSLKPLSCSLFAWKRFTNSGLRGTFHLGRPVRHRHNVACSIHWILLREGRGRIV